MANNIINRVWNNLTGRNKFNYSFISSFGGEYTSYDKDNSTYLDKGYNYNSIIYSIINKQAIKTSSIPFVVKKVDDKEAKNKLDNLYKSTKGNLSPLQKIKSRHLEIKAFNGEYLELPLKKPNANQTWAEFHQLYKTFLKLFGNVYIYLLTPEEGMNAGTPIAVYLLPSQDVKIVTKDNADLLGVESPIKSYMLIQGKQYVEFGADKVLHIKYNNANYDEDGEHLYGMSPLKAALRNIQSANKAVDNNIKTLANSGAFGFIHGKNAAIQENQAKEIKERLSEMNNNPDDLAKIAGISAEIGFTRISLTTDELKPFEYLKYDEKQLCNVLGYSDKLLNNDDGAKYDNVNSARKMVVTDDIKPDLMMLEQGFWKPFLAMYKGYDNTVLEYDISELPEMQEDTEKMVNWGVQLLDRGVLNRNELREVVTFAVIEDEAMNVYTVANDVLTLEEAIDSEFRIEE